jgi:hypothetical protein
VVYAHYHTTSPAVGAEMSVGGIRELMAGEVVGLQVPPEVPACPVCWPASQGPGDLPRRRVDNPNWNEFPRLPYRKHEIGVVRDDDGGIHVAAKHVQQQVRRNVDIGALLFPLSDRYQEVGVCDLRPCRVDDRDRPSGSDELWLRTARGAYRSRAT